MCVFTLTRFPPPRTTFSTCYSLKCSIFLLLSLVPYFFSLPANNKLYLLVVFQEQLYDISHAHVFNATNLINRFHTYWKVWSLSYCQGVRTIDGDTNYTIMLNEGNATLSSFVVPSDAGLWWCAARDCGYADVLLCSPPKTAHSCDGTVTVKNQQRNESSPHFRLFL